jgi:hypothetical protein
MTSKDTRDIKEYEKEKELESKNTKTPEEIQELEDAWWQAIK